MITDLARVAVGVPAVAFTVISLPWLTRHRVVGVLVAAAALAGVAWPLLDGPRGWVLLAAGTIAAAGLLWTTEPTGGDVRRQLPISAVGALVLAAIVVVVADADATVDALQRVLDANTVWFVAAMVLLAVPVGGQVVAWALQPYARQVETEQRSLVAAGRVIGWLERSLLFALLAAGQPEAAGLALAAKTVARFPQLRGEDEPLAEYILVGTLVSVTVAGVCAAATRAALGLSLL